MATKFITVSIEIMHDNNLNQSQKFLLAEIEQLSTLEKGCIGSNNHFASLIGITKENVSKNINDLAKKGYINVEIVNGSRNHTRIITLTNLVRPPYQNSKTPLSKQQETKGRDKSNKTKNRTIGDFDLIELVDEIFNQTDNLSLKVNYDAFKEWIAFRKDIKKPLTKISAKKQLLLLVKYSEEIQREIIDASIMNGYQGLFEPKQNNFNNQAMSKRKKPNHNINGAEEYQF